MKKIAVLVGVLSLALAYDQVLAKNGVALLGVPFTPADGIERTLNLPEAATENAHRIFLGEATDPATGETVQGYALLTRESAQNNYAKPPWAGGGSGGKDDTSSCYSFQAKGAKWKAKENWVVNPANNAGISSADVFSIMDQAVNQWEDAGDGVVGNGIITDEFGTGSLTNDILEADVSAPDTRNEVYFASIDEPGVIAVTIVWGYFSGPPHSRELIAWDQVYDQVDYDWGTVQDPTKMDFDNIATHEVGHAFGLSHAEAPECNQETMYPTAAYGETLKRDLNAGDIAGMDELY